MAARYSSRLIAILRGADDLRNDLLTSRALLPEGKEEVEFANSGLPIQKTFEETLDLVGPILRAAEDK